MSDHRCSNHYCDREATLIIDSQLYCTHCGVQELSRRYEEAQRAEVSA